MVIFIFLKVNSEFLVSNENHYVDLSFAIIDSETKTNIANYTVIVTDLNQEFYLSSTKNDIKLSKNSFSTNTGKYQRGYTFLVCSDGYLPTIINDVHINSEGSAINIELYKQKTLPNKEYVELFLPEIKESINDLINYYFDGKVNSYFITNDTKIKNTIMGNLEKKANQGQWNIKIIDSVSKMQIDKAFIIVTDTCERYDILGLNNSISLPQKPIYTDDGKYQYGYDIIVGAAGYLPKIENNVSMIDNIENELVIELSKPEMNNAYYSAKQHESYKEQVRNFLSYYLSK